PPATPRLMIRTSALANNEPLLRGIARGSHTGESPLFLAGYEKCSGHPSFHSRSDCGIEGGSYFMGNNSAQGSLTDLAQRIFIRLVENPAVCYYARTHFYGGTMRRLRSTLDLQPGETLLDVGCGSGMGAGLTQGAYVGIDTHMIYLRFARNRLRDVKTHTFM